jgi:murein DD-endopeptidase MepM/ murein hydrolase activator NlpD
MKRVWFTSATAAFPLFLIMGIVAAEPAGPSRPRVVEVSQGGIAEIRIDGAGLISVKGRLGEQTVPFYEGQAGVFSAAIGVDLDAKPGPLKLAIQKLTQTGTQKDSAITVMVREKTFAKESLSVAAQFEQFSTATLERIRREQDELNRVFTISTPQRLWEGSFVPPVAGGVTSPFGLRRVINGTARAPHSGVDLKAPEGTEVRAANHGRVTLCADFFFSGKSLVIDHGGGLFTMYFHLADFKVEAGTQVEKGETIGWSGMTGRVTGPHLHWGARLNGARIDPFELLAKLGKP